MDISMMESIPVPMFLYKEKIVSANSAFLKLTGYDIEEVRDKEVWEFFDEQSHDEIKYAVQQRLLNNFPQKEYQLKLFTKKNNRHWVHVVTTTAYFHNEYIGLATLFDITEKKELEEELFLKNELWTDIFNRHSAVMLLIDSESGEIVDANPGAEKFYKYTAHQLKKMNINQINTMSKKQIYAKMNKAKKRNENEFFFEHKLANGERRHVQVFSSEVQAMGKNLLFSIIHDATDRVVYEQKLLDLNTELEESKQRYKSLFSYNPNISFALDVNGYFTQINDVLETILGYYDDELINKRFDSVLKGSSKKDANYAFQQVLDGEAVNFITDVIRKNGSIVNLNVTGVPIKTGNNVVGVMGIAEDITERKRLEKELKLKNETLKKFSSMDGLTGVSNRRYFDERLEKEWNRSLRYQQNLSLIMFDLDQFKPYNDTYGHHKGDQCLKAVSKAVQNTLRRSTDCLARYGGEEFAVILPETDHQSALHTAEMIRSTIEALHIPHENSKVKPIVTVSVGFVTLVPSENLDIKDLIEKADSALYKAKNSGRNKVVEYMRV
ncbi:sensor domain-containing diguanylate cyclase [Texcoconibacillus texcoconensis]|uniref:Diguanylate cyclase (GGDEF)-like protein/PAS domain S-box-containing protein n=1 Tax=Texcoconibacillus texcoconensis TaxID=1095777 RepID=A0A840QT83_9BACI|nr:sensor domain-containing diguanylate cyclase [Texcoconibacillus texcoconensis]MBB5174518.1 diguanylate cyclase (GGDEF)-like protein/PAS domain S-box-containing protein [Texcoconibacillus texcoconensis]